MSSNPQVIINAPKAEVEQLLRDALSEEQRSNVLVSTKVPARNPLRPERQGEYETLSIVIEFAAMTIASGVAYDLLKLIVKVAVDRFGKDKVS